MTMSRIKTEVISWTKEIAFILIFVFILNQVVIVNAYIPSGSMENTMMIGDRVIAFRLSYEFSDPKRSDIIVFSPPDGEPDLYIKRIIGVPGDIVEIKDGIVYINNEILEDDSSYVKGEPFGNFGPYNVPEESYFVMGDNRNGSIDSRSWQNTFVPKDKIVGKAIFRYFPNFNTF